MKKILLSNVGNRNITYKGETYDYKKFKMTFKEWTFELLNNFQDEKEFIKLNIINDLIDEIQVDTSHVILFYSNQIKETKQDQDTLYEAQLMKYLIEEKYPTIEVRLEEIQCKVTNNDELLKKYRAKLKALRKEFVHHQFVICDAGGTAQQKASLKIMSEFLLNENSFIVKYVNPDGILEDVKQIEYRKIIVSEQVKAFIDKGEYKAALNLWGINNPLDSQSVKGNFERLLCFAYFRYNNYYEAISQITYKISFLELNPDIIEYKQKSTLITLCEWSKILSSEVLFKVGEYLEILKFQWLKGRMSDAILSISKTFEYLINALIEQKYGYRLTDPTNYGKELNRLSKEAKVRFPNVALAFSDEDIKQGLPFLIAVAENIEFEPAQQLLSFLKKYISNGVNWKFAPNDSKTLAINTLRNKIAHNGKYVDEMFIKEYLPYLDSFLSLLFDSFSIEESYFEELNQRLYSLMEA